MARGVSPSVASANSASCSSTAKRRSSFRLHFGDASECVRERAVVFLLPEDVGQRVGGHERRSDVGFGGRENGREHQSSALRVATCEKQLSRVGQEPAAQQGILHARSDLHQGLRSDQIFFEFSRERHVAIARVVVRGIEKDGTFERFERAR